jgi:trehalose 6-phosphate synthase/phosphatase
MGGDAGGDMPVVWHCDQSGDKKEEDKEGVEVNSLIGAIPNRSNKRDLIKRKSGGLDVTPSYYSKKLLGEGGRAGASLGEADGVIIVGHKLPVFLSRDANGVFSCKWNYDNYLGSRMNPQDMDGMKLRVQWIGTISIRNETGPNAPVPEECEEEVEQLLRQFNCSPIFIPQDLYDPFYEGFCFGTLWPVFHNIADVYGEHPTRWWNANEQGTAWQAYTTVNRLFANKVVEVYDKGDLVWVNDLHLLLVPSFLSRRLRSANIGLFLHTPFPSSEIFRTLSVREDLLRGILSADHIGFHLFEYARHFLACCRRILNITWQSEDGGIIGLNYGGRTVAITVSHVGIEPVLVDHALQQIAVKQKIEEYRQKYKGKFVIGGIDRLERLKGVPLKLLAFEKFLEANPALRDKVVFRQIGCTYGCHRWKLNSKLKGRTVQEAKMLCKRINEKYGEVVDYVEWHTNVALEDRVAVWAVSNVILLSSIREGVNLYPYEYVHTRGNKPGVMILSEFSSCSRVLNGALRINPWRIKDMVEALEHAYKMGETERESRMKRHRKYVAEHTTIAWAERVLMDMKRAKKQNEADYVAYGLGMGFRLMHMDHHFTPLNEDKVCAQPQQLRIHPHSPAFTRTTTPCTNPPTSLTSSRACCMSILRCARTTRPVSAGSSYSTSGAHSLLRRSATTTRSTTRPTSATTLLQTCSTRS